MPELRYGSLFSGYLGLDMGVQSVLGGTTAWVSDIDKGACKILTHRAPGVPNLGDITTVDWSSVEPVDVLTGGSPCQDLSHAGKRQGMTEGTRSNLWVAMREAIAQLRPRIVVWENVRGAYSACADSEMGRCPRCVDPDSGSGHAPHLRALGRVLGDLSELGYDAQWHGLRAADVGAPHGRFRVFLVATDARGVGHEWARAARDWRSGFADHGAEHHSGALGPLRPAGLLPTPRGTDHHDSMNAPGARRHVEAGNGTLAETIGYELIGTPRASEWKGSGPVGSKSHEHMLSHDYLCAQVLLLPTPTDVTKGGGKTRSGARSGEALLNGIDRLIPTPLNSDAGPRGGTTGFGLRDWSRANAERWGAYATAVSRWEAVLDREAPAPTQASLKGNPQLSPAFVEWLMGLPAGWVTDVPGITRNEALKALGNGVVPQQAAAALRHMLAMEMAA